MRLRNVLLDAGVLGVLLVFVSVLLFVDFGAEAARVVDEVFNFGHLPLFGIVALAFLRLFSRRDKQARGPGPYVLAFLAALSLGIVTELVQVYMPERFFEMQDIAYDGLGAITFLVFAYPFPGLSRMAARWWKVAAACVIAAAMAPIGLTALDDWRMHRDFPLLGSFETRLEMGRWEPKESTLHRSLKHASHGEHALEVRLAQGEFPGISLNCMETDWRGYDELCFDAYLEGDEPLAVTVRIHDETHCRSPEQLYSDRFNRRFVLSPGVQWIRIDLNDVKIAPAGREMDMRRIANICVFAYRLGEERTVFFDNFRLEAGTGVQISKQTGGSQKQGGQVSTNDIEMSFVET